MTLHDKGLFLTIVMESGGQHSSMTLIHTVGPYHHAADYKGIFVTRTENGIHHFLSYPIDTIEMAPAQL